MASRKKIPSDRPTERLPPMNKPNEPFVEDEDPTDFPKTEPPSDLESLTEPPPHSPSTSPELGYYVCPACHAVDPSECDTCMGMGIIDRETMADFKKKETLQ